MDHAVSEIARSSQDANTPLLPPELHFSSDTLEITNSPKDTTDLQIDKIKEQIKEENL